jgi:polyisoprenyl-teichoic acid--peptidoglycan teichoic acid transferase
LAPRIAAWVIVFVLIVLAAFSYRIITVGKEVIESENDNSVFHQIKQLVTEDTRRKLKGEDDNRINVLLLGLGGEGHAGGGNYLTDTIIVASIRPEDNSVALLSIPRDLYVRIPGFWSAKINSAYALSYAKTKDEAAASGLAAEIITEVTGLPIHYYVRVDFDGFKQVVDTIGGVDVDVETAFVDRQYPTYNLGYQTIRFDEGPNHFDGETALKFARSRYGNNGEGSDFARAKRQQKILDAVRNRVLSTGTLLNPAKVNGLLGTLGNHVGTNIELWEMERLIEFAKKYDSEQLSTRVLDDTAKGLLKFGSTPGAGSILLPRAGQFQYQEIHQLADRIFDEQFIEQEEATIEVYNGTGVSGLAQRVATDLEQVGFDVVRIANAPTGEFERSVIHDRTDGQKPYTLRALINDFKANVSTIDVTIPPISDEDEMTDLDTDTEERGDFVLIVGTDYYQQLQSFTQR